MKPVRRRKWHVNFVKTFGLTNIRVETVQPSSSKEENGMEVTGSVEEDQSFYAKASGSFGNMKIIFASYTATVFK